MYKMNIRKMVLYPLILFSMVFLVSCTQVAPIPLTITAETTPSTAPIPSETAYPTATHTPIATSTPELYPCIETSELQGVEFASMKGLIVAEFDPTTRSWSYRVSGNELLEQVVENFGHLIGLIQVGPNHRSILLTSVSMSGENWDEKVIDIQGHIIWSATGKPLTLFIDWFDDTRLWDVSTANNTYQLTLVNPFTGNVQKLRTDFPEPGDMGYFWKMPQTHYSSDLTKVVYPGAPYSFPSYFPIIFYDARKDQEIARIPTYSRSGPIWLPDGSGFVFVGDFKPDATAHNDIYSMDLEGNLKQLTLLNDAYPGVRISPNLSFSSDSRYMAFWFSYDTSSSTTSESRFAVMDMETNKLDIYCLQGANELDHHEAYSFGTPVWSPDNTLIAIPIHDPSNPSEKGVGIIPVSEKKVSIIRGLVNVQPIGWLDIP